MDEYKTKYTNVRLTQIETNIPNSSHKAENGKHFHY